MKNKQPFFGKHHTLVLDLSKEDDRVKYDELMTKQAQGKIFVHRDQVEKTQDKETNEIRFIALVQYYDINAPSEHLAEPEDIAEGIPNPSRELLTKLNSEPSIPAFNLNEL